MPPPRTRGPALRVLRINDKNRPGDALERREKAEELIACVHVMKQILAEGKIELFSKWQLAGVVICKHEVPRISSGARATGRTTPGLLLHEALNLLPLNIITDAE